MVAEVKCTTLNFFENHYNNFQIENLNEKVKEVDFWKENKYHPDPLFYQVSNSSVLNEKIRYLTPIINLA